MVKIIILHPDLGIGGAERLIVDAAVALKESGHSIEILTSHHDSGHCFEETRNGLLPVSVYGDWLPRTIFGYCYALCAYIRMIYLALCLIISTKNPDVIIIDQISIPIPLLTFKTPNILFYCHFPDQLLSKQGNFLKSVYRAPLNWLEDYTTNKAKKILVNSQFTAKVFMNTFSFAKQLPDILYPSLVTQKFDKVVTESNDGRVIFLSLNRFERKKNIALAIYAFDWVVRQHPNCVLIIAGGYDENLLENVEHFKELEDVIKKLELGKKIEMIKSPDDETKIMLIRSARCLIYTPENEHFGIVPVEAMYLKTPVLAVNSGGPTESVQDGVTGFLRDPTPIDFGRVLLQLYDDPELAERIGEQGHKRVQDCFSFQQFTKRLNNAINSVINS